jgi:peptide/nickel transport system permease protein
VSGTPAAGAVLAVIVLAAVWPALLATHQPEAVSLTESLAGPGSRHWFGTDQLGRDIYSRVVYGARPSLIIGVGATAVAVGIGSALATIAAIGGRVADEIVMRLTDVFLSFPGILLALLVVAMLGPGTTNATLAIGCAFAPGFTRLVRGEALVVRESGYVQASVVLGYRWPAIYLRHVLPNALPPLLALGTLTVGTAVLAGSALSFLGLGPRAPSGARCSPTEGTSSVPPGPWRSSRARR